ncbi:hypothetical protein, partial [Haliangium sp. UPWRP_2]|uniref:hypothetical protein n=1 Tax=Haliangium sp. UPWRP_2 TaxID=1931276 RepID=UPI001E4309F7
QKNARSARCGSDGTIALIGDTAAAHAACVRCANVEGSIQVADRGGALRVIRSRRRSAEKLCEGSQQGIACAPSEPS